MFNFLNFWAKVGFSIFFSVFCFPLFYTAVHVSFQFDKVIILPLGPAGPEAPVFVSHSLLISATFDVIVDTSITFFVLFFSRLLISSIFFSFISEKVLKDFLQPHLVLFDISCPCM